MKYRRSMLAVPLVLVTLLLASAASCPKVDTGADPFLVNCERDLKGAVRSLNSLFETDAANWQAIDPVIPQWKDSVNALRIVAPPIIDTANASLKSYRSALAIYRANPNEMTQAELNTLGSKLGHDIVEAVNLGKQAAALISDFAAKKGGGK